MRPAQLLEMLQQVAGGALDPAQALERLKGFPAEDLGFAQVDHMRPLLQGHGEVVLCEGKTTEQVAAICRALANHDGAFLATRASEADITCLADEHPRAAVNELARTVFLPHPDREPPRCRGKILIVCAGTSDLRVAEEAAVVAEALGNEVLRINDVGVAGIHRILSRRQELWDAAVVVVVAGMDGALVSVVGGMVAAPIIAVPTSVGYGASFGGVAALLSMLNSCASGVSVVNIDNGFGAAVAASRINLINDL